MAVGSMTCVQIGLALSVPLFGQLGPLGVAVARARSGQHSGRRRLLWPGLAAVGVVVLTHPWQGGGSTLGIVFALGAAVCWAAYILLTQAVGDEVAGLEGLAVSIPV